MRKILNAKLTSNDFINKLLLTNPQLDTCFEYTSNRNPILHCRYPYFVSILTNEMSENRLSQLEFENILVKHFELPQKLNQLNDNQKLLLITLNSFIDELKHDQSYVIRKQLASRGYFLNEYTYDTNADVRIEVAQQLYNLEILMNDEDLNVRNVAQFNASFYSKNLRNAHKFNMH